MTLTWPSRFRHFSTTCCWKRYVRKNYNFDFFVGFENDQSSEQMLALFRDVKNQPGVVKGYLKVVL